MTARKLKLDYFRIYDVENRSVDARVGVQGQFDREADEVYLKVLDYFAVAVSKNGEPIYDKHAHLNWYRVFQRVPEPTRIVTVENQFGRHEVRLGNVFALLVPAQKYERGSLFPKKLDHFKVYWALEHRVINRKVKLQDQFGRDEVTVMVPHFFAVPVKKWHRGTVQPIRNKTHLFIYSTTPRDVRQRALVGDQFGRYPLGVFRSIWLAVPTLKLKWKEV